MEPLIFFHDLFPSTCKRFRISLKKISRNGPCLLWFNFNSILLSLHLCFSIAITGSLQSTEPPDFTLLLTEKLLENNDILFTMTIPNISEISKIIRDINFHVNYVFRGFVISTSTQTLAKRPVDISPESISVLIAFPICLSNFLRMTSLCKSIGRLGR